MTDSQSKICWRPEWRRPLESLWSLLCKARYLNTATGTDIRDVFKRRTSYDVPQRRPYLRRDLNSLIEVDEGKLAELLSLERSHLATATAIGYIRQEEIPLLTSNQLRYCPDCISVGFHTAIHQLLFVSHCPIHFCPLVTRCKECGAISPRYTLSSLTYRPDSKCTHCFNALVDNFILVSQSTSPGESRELNDLANWLQERTSARWMENYGFAWSFFRGRSKCRHKNLQRLPRYWCEPLPFDADDLGPKLPDRQHHYSITTSLTDGVPPLTVLEGVKLDFEKELTSDFRAISRNLSHQVLWRHKQCIHDLKKHVCWSVPTRYWRGRICVAANAFLLWLMRCQNINDPMQLFQASTKLRTLSPDIFVQHNGALPLSAFRRIVALNWASLFYEALLVSYGLNRKGLYSLCPGLVEGVRRPYWLVEWPSNESQILHWWMQNRFTDRIASDKKLCPGPLTKSNKWRTQQCSCLT
jgi:TniQ